MCARCLQQQLSSGCRCRSDNTMIYARQQHETVAVVVAGDLLKQLDTNYAANRRSLPYQ